MRVMVPNGEQKIILENMLMGHGCKCALLLVVPGRVDSKRRAERVPGLLGNQVVFRDCSVFQVVSAGLTAPQPKSLPAAVTVAAKPSTVVLCKICKEYCTKDEWLEAEKRPQKAFASWAAGHACSVLDTWKWSRDNSGDRSRFTGIARIPVDQVEQVLTASGQGGWFVDPFKDTQCNPWVTAWQAREDGVDSLEKSSTQYGYRCWYSVFGLEGFSR